MLERTDGSEMCINEMTVILMSLGVTTANFKVTGLFCRSRFSDSAVDIGFERGIVADKATGWMNGNVGQQRLYATEASLVGRRTTVCGNKGCGGPGGPNEASACCEEPDGWRETSVVDWVSNVLHHHDQVAECRVKTRKTSRRTRCDPDDDAGCTQTK